MVNSLSLLTTPVELHKEDTKISSGTGFYYRSTWNGIERIFLVTNYHVITGNEVSQRHINPQGNFVVFYLHLDADNPSSVVGLKIPTITTTGKRIWLEHSNKAVDIVVIPIMFSLPIKPDWNAVDKSLVEADIDISATDSVTLIGYPVMFFDKKNALPIYKTGNIASEYDYDFGGDPCFMIDISAFSGNSGSPVFSIRKNAQIISDTIFIKAHGSVTKFLGVYSAGITYNEHFLPIREIRKEQEKGIVTDLDMQLGVVWRASLIEEIIKENSYKSYEEIAKELVREKGFKYKISQGLELF